MTTPVTIQVIVPITTEGFRDVSVFEGLLGPDVRITQSQIAKGPASVECDLDEALAAPGVAARAVEAEQAGADAIVIDCMGDPGMDAAREVVSIPVLGPCLTAMHAASMLAHKFSVVTVMDRLIPSFERRAAVYGLTTMASCRSVEVPVLDLEAEREQSVKRLTEESIAAIEQDGAHAIVLGCTGMLGWAQDIEQRLVDAGYPGVPVVDPIPLTLHTAAALVGSGLVHSKRTYPQPPTKARKGWDSTI
jgi:allantoin racemase